jgi:2-oxoglutarate dehydrogenase E2 component (dihydrolipoamide succinyltransferase)
MSTEVVMPQMGESITEGTIVKWHKKLGERIDRDEPLFEITTDKVDTEVPAPAAGVLEQILVQEGETVAVGTVVATLGNGAAETSTEASAQPKVSAAHFRSSHEPKTFQRKAKATTPPPQTPQASPPPPGTTKQASAHEEGGQRLSPAVISLANRHRLPMGELLSISGSGAGGRITKKDVQAYIERRPPSPPSATPPQALQAPAPPPVSASATAPLPPPQYLYRPEPDDKLIPMSGMRQQIADHMIWSQQISAQVTSFTECDMHRIVRHRDEHGAHFEEAEGMPLSFTPFVAEATVRALKEFPIFNASVVGDQIALKKHVHLGIAVALDQGLIVPVIRDADEANFVGLARSIHTVAEKARHHGLVPEDVQGATFTITNPGMFGGLTGTPMIAQPQVAILGLGAIQKKPVVVDDAIAIRPIMVLALTFDHRIIDGATGFQFLERIRIHLEQFDLP